MDRNDRIKERERAVRAQQIIDNPLWVEAQTIVLRNLEEAWINTAVTQNMERETIWHMRNAAANAFNYIEDVIKTGKLAEMQLEKTNG